MERGSNPIWKLFDGVATIFGKWRAQKAEGYRAVMHLLITALRRSRNFRGAMGPADTRPGRARAGRAGRGRGRGTPRVPDRGAAHVSRTYVTQV